MLQAALKYFEPRTFCDCLSTVTTDSVVINRYGRNHWGVGGPDPPKNLDGPPPFYVAF